MFRVCEAVFSLTFYAVFSHLAVNLVAKDLPKLLLSNDGPAILDSNLTFRASFNDPKYEHNFVFVDNTSHPRKRSVRGMQNVSLSLKYNTERYQQGHYIMAVKVYRNAFHDPIEEWRDPIVSGKMDFQLSEFMVGEIAVYQEGAEDEYYSTNKDIIFRAVIHDPSGYFDDKMISYTWTIDNIQFADAGENITYNFTKGGDYSIQAIAVAYGMHSEATYHSSFKWGYFKKQISVQEPVTVINVTGNTWIRHGDLLSLNVSCDGSGSFEYCWEILPANETDANITCKEPVVSTTCNFFIIRYFSKPGSHYIKVFAGNFLSHQQKTIEARIYDVSRRPQLSTVIIPIVCSVLTIVIIIMGVAYHIQHRRQYRIEVADFDFHQTEDLVEKTFFERLRDSFKNALCSKNQFSYRKETDERDSPPEN